MILKNSGYNTRLFEDLYQCKVELDEYSSRNEVVISFKLIDRQAEIGQKLLKHELDFKYESMEGITLDQDDLAFIIELEGLY